MIPVTDKPQSLKSGRTSVLQVRVTPAEKIRFEQAAHSAGVSVSDFVRLQLDMYMGPQTVTQFPKQIKPWQKEDTRPSWASVFFQMIQVDPEVGRHRFQELAQGRNLPVGFKGWAEPQKVEWLDANWPLAEDWEW